MDRGSNGLTATLFAPRTRRTAAQRRRQSPARHRLGLDSLEQRYALAVPGFLSIGGQTAATYFDAPTGPGSLSNNVLVFITGTSGTATFNGGAGVNDGTDISTITITNASSDFRITFQAGLTTSGPNASDGVVELGAITSTSVIGGVYTTLGAETPVPGTSFNYVTTAVPSASSVSTLAPTVSIDFVTVGDPGNVGQTLDYLGTPLTFGAVAEDFQIGKYEVTIQQYTDFLNSVAATDPYSLYNPSMATNLNIAGISRSGSSGSYTYSVLNNAGNSANRPITFVSWLDAARFANWMHNGQGSGDTENGAYTLNGATSGPAPARNPGARFFIPTEDQWYKAAYYKGGGTDAGYWAYATQSDSAPGNVIGSGPNQANYEDGVYAVTGSSSYSLSDNYLTDVGAFTNSLSTYGTFDQSGNVREWNDLTGAPDVVRGVRGGFWNNGNPLNLSSSNRGTSPTSFEASSIGFRLAAPGPDSTQLYLTGDQTGSFGGTGSTVQITPTGGSPLLRTVNSVYFDGTYTIIELFEPIPGSASSGTVAPVEFTRVQYNLGSYTGPNLAANGGIFVDSVGTGSGGGITLTRGLTNTATIDIRGVPGSPGTGLRDGAAIVLGTTSKDTVAGSMFVTNADEGSAITFNGAVAPVFALLTRSTFDTFASPFAAAITANAAFNGRIDSATWLAGPLRFNKGFGQQAVIQNARPIVDMQVTGNFAGKTVSADSTLSLVVTGNVAKSAIINSGQDLSLTVGGGVAKGSVITGGAAASIAIARDLAGKVLVGQGLSMTVGGSLNGATVATESATSITVNGSMTNRSFIESDGELSLNVAGNVSKVSRILATDSLTASIGGSFTDGRADASQDMSMAVLGNVTNVRLTANDDLNLTVGDVANGRRSTVSGSRLTSSTGYVVADIAGNLLKSTFLSMDDGHLVTVGGNVLDTDFLFDDRDTVVDVGGNFRGRIQGSNGDVTLTTGGSVLKGAIVSANQYQEGTMVIDVAGNFAGSVTSAPYLVFLVNGNVEQSASITARRIGQSYPQADVPANFFVGGTFAGKLEALDFTASNDPNAGVITLVGGNVTSTGVFRISRFTDIGANESYRFGSNFLGRLVVGGDLDADLAFAGNVNEVVIGGAVQADVTIAGALTHFSTGGSSFVQIGPASGEFVIGLPPATVGTLSAGSFRKGVNTVVPRLPVV